MARETVFDTTYIRILVKGYRVRVDELDRRSAKLSSHIVDLEHETIVALCDYRRIFMHLPVREQPTNLASRLEVTKTENYKVIKGFKCFQWRVRDRVRNTEVAYWVAQERFEFFESLLNLLNRSELSLSIFPLIPDNQEFFPMLTEERTLLRKRKLQIAVVQIAESDQRPEDFSIPSNFTRVRGF